VEIEARGNMYYIVRRLSLDLSRLPFKGTLPETENQVAVYDPSETDLTQATFRVNVTDLSTILGIEPAIKSAASSYFSENAVSTNIIVQNEFVKIAGSTITGPIVRGFDVGVNLFTLTGASADFKMSTTLTVDDGVGTLIAARYRIIPFDAPPFLCPQCLGTGQIPPMGAEQSFSIQAALPLRTGDAVEVWIANRSGTNDVVVKNYNTIIHQI
jgi:hypothetical protein